MTTNDVLAITSIILGIISIAISIVFFILSNKLSSKTTKAIDEIKAATSQLQEINENYIKTIFELFKMDHVKLTENHFGNTMTGGNLEEKQTHNKQQ